MTIGILSLQGDFNKHRCVLEKIGVETHLVRDTSGLSSVDALVIPGGESTTMGKLIMSFGLTQLLEERIINEHMPVFGTCAGMILLAAEIRGFEQYSIKALDITVQRNAYGRQIESFETHIPVNLPDGSRHDARGVFIRAPQILRMGSGIQVLASYEDHPVLVQQGNILAASFHPELTPDTSIHQYFCQITQKVISTTT